MDTKIPKILLNNGKNYFLKMLAHKGSTDKVLVFKDQLEKNQLQEMQQNSV